MCLRVGNLRVSASRARIVGRSKHFIGRIGLSMYQIMKLSPSYLIKLGFRRGPYNPCLYFHQERMLRTFLHGDDFATVGDRKE